jgi:hypothetical protein
MSVEPAKAAVPPKCQYQSTKPQDITFQKTSKLYSYYFENIKSQIRSLTDNLLIQQEAKETKTK